MRGKGRALHRAQLTVLVAGALLLLPAAPSVMAQTFNTAQEALAEARKAADSHRNKDAIQPYRDALRLSAADRPDWRLELAEQLSWSGQLVEAIDEYRRVLASGQSELLRKAGYGLGRALAWTGEHDAAVEVLDDALKIEPMDRDTLLLRAKILGWASRHTEAEMAYRVMLERDPADQRALLGLARVQSWRGHYRKALATLERLPEAPEDAGEAVTIASEANQWMGRPDRSRKVALRRLADAPDDSQALALLARLDRDYSSELRLDARRFDQSDGLDVEQINLSATVPIDHGRGRVGPRLAYAAFAPSDGDGDVVTVTRAGLAAAYRISDTIDVNAAFSIDTIDNPGKGGSKDFLTFDAYVTIFPSDRWRIDTGVQRYLFDSDATLRNRLVAEQYKASVDFLPTERTRISARFAYGDYSDGNRQFGWQAEVEQRIMSEPKVHVGIRYSGTDFRLVNQPGYFSPDLYHAAEVLMRIDGRVGERTYFGARVSGGGERDIGGADRFIVSASTYLRRDLTDRFAVEAAYDYSSSRTMSANGFERGIGRLSLIARF